MSASAIAELSSDLTALKVSDSENSHTGAATAVQKAKPANTMATKTVLGGLKEALDMLRSSFAFSMPNRVVVIGSRAMCVYQKKAQPLVNVSDYDFVMSPKAFDAWSLSSAFEFVDKLSMQFSRFDYDAHYVPSMLKPKPQSKSAVASTKVSTPEKSSSTVDGKETSMGKTAPETSPSTIDGKDNSIGKSNNSKPMQALISAAGVSNLVESGENKASTRAAMLKVQMKLKTGECFDIEIPLDSEVSAGMLLTQLPLCGDRRSFRGLQPNGRVRSCFPKSFPRIEVAPLSILERLKKSHIYWPIHFQKHIEHLHELRRLMLLDASSKVDAALLDRFFKTRLGETEQMHGIPGEHIRMNQSNEDFLDKEGLLTVRKMIPHDDIHELVKFGSVPMYTRIKKDQSKAACDQKLFEALSLEERVQDVQEEGMVLALERYLLLRRLHDPEEAYRRALERICTTITKGWFREFAIDHYPAIRNLPAEKNLARFRDHIFRLGKSSRETRTSLWNEWFTHDELQQLEPFRKSWVDVEEKSTHSPRYDWERVERLGCATFKNPDDKCEYMLCWSSSHSEGSCDCTYNSTNDYSFKLTRRELGWRDYESWASWRLQVDTETGQYDSNRGEVERDFSMSLDLPDESILASQTEQQRQSIISLLTQHLLKPLVLIVMGYGQWSLPPFHDPHFLVRFFLVHFIQKHAEDDHYIPGDLSDAIDQELKNRPNKLQLQRDGLLLPDTLRLHPFYQYFLVSRYAPNFYALSVSRS
jgi:hypothetical protein